MARKINEIDRLGTNLKDDHSYGVHVGLEGGQRINSVCESWLEQLWRHPSGCSVRRACVAHKRRGRSFQSYTSEPEIGQTSFVIIVYQDVCLHERPR